MSAIRRLKKELEDVRQPEGVTSSFFYNLKVDEANVLHWEGIIVSDKEPYASKNGKKVRHSSYCSNI